MNLREVAKAALDEWRDDPGSVRMASLMMALQNAVFEDEQRGINAQQITKAEMLDWVAKAWEECQKQAWKHGKQ